MRQTVSEEEGLETAQMREGAGLIYEGAGLIYEAEVKATDKSDKKYLGCTATTFTKRHANHKSDFKHEHRRHATKLSGYVWKLKEEGVQHEIKFKIVRKAKEYSPKTEMCNL